MELQGKIIAVLDPKTGESKRNEGEKWMSQDFVMEYASGQYSRKMVFNIWGEEKINRANLHVGDEVAVQFDVDAREWNGRWFTDIKAYHVEHINATATATDGTQMGDIPPFTPEESNAIENLGVQPDMFEQKSGDLPF